MKEISKVKQYDLYIFDFDQTLFDTLKGQIQCAKAALAEIGIREITDSDVKQGNGLTLSEFLGKFTDDPQEIGRMERVFWQRSAEVMVELAAPFASTIPTITELKTRGAKLGIVTGKFRDRVGRILRRFSLEEMFDFIVCGDELKNDKPDPEGLMRCLSQFPDVEKNQAVYIGDHYYDMLAAQHCGIDSIAITTGTLNHEELAKYEANFVIDDLSELL